MGFVRRAPKLLSVGEKFFSAFIILLSRLKGLEIYSTLMLEKFAGHFTGGNNLGQRLCATLLPNNKKERPGRWMKS